MKTYKVTFIVADATGYVHELAMGKVMAKDAQHALDSCNNIWGQAENGAYYQLEAVN